MHGPTTALKDRQIKATSQSSIRHQLRRLLALHGIAGLSRMVTAKAIGLLVVDAFAPTSEGGRPRKRPGIRSTMGRQYERTACPRRVGKLLVNIGSTGLATRKSTRTTSNGCSTTSRSTTRNSAFVDFGSGKGRAILVASRLPFRKVIGVEYSEPLTKIAQENISIFRKHHTICDIEAVWADAAWTFPFPPDHWWSFSRTLSVKSSWDALIEKDLGVDEAIAPANPGAVFPTISGGFVESRYRSSRKCERLSRIPFFESTDGVHTSAPRLRRCG